MQASGLSPRSLRDHFHDCVGIPPKQALRACRFGALLSELAHTAGRADWRSIIPRYHYYDQSHFIAEFRSATSMAPEAFMRSRPAMLLNYLLLPHPPLSHVPLTRRCAAADGRSAGFYNTGHGGDL
jgi:AraC-like DNA-binding protein